MRTAAVFLVALSLWAEAAGKTSPQATDSRNLMWCSAKSGKTLYYSAWFRYSPENRDAHRDKFQKDTQANYNLSALDIPNCYSYQEPSMASDAFDADVKRQKRAGYKVVTTGWMPAN